MRIICGKEVAPQTGTPHLQGAVVFTKPMRMKAVKTALGGVAHLEPMRGKWADQSYCAKEGELVRMEDNSKQGERTDLVEFKDAIKRGAPTEELIENHLDVLAQYPRLETRLKGHYAKQATREFRNVKRVTIVGKGGAGKSRKALYDGAGKRLPDTFIVPSTNNLQWWNGYEGEKTIIINEMGGAKCKYDRWKEIVDGHQLMIEVKNGITYAAWTKVIMTSNVEMDEWWPNVKNARMCEEEFSRRIGEVHRY